MNTAPVELSCSWAHWIHFGPIEAPAADPGFDPHHPELLHPALRQQPVLAGPPHHRGGGVAVRHRPPRRAELPGHRPPVVGLQLLHRDHIRAGRRDRPAVRPRSVWCCSTSTRSRSPSARSARTGSTSRQRHRRCRRPWRWRWWSRSWCSAAATTPPRAARAPRGPAPTRRPAEHRTATRTAPRCSDLRTLVSDPMGVGAADVATHPPPALRRPVPTTWLRPDGSVQTQLRAASPHV